MDKVVITRDLLVARVPGDEFRVGIYSMLIRGEPKVIRLGLYEAQAVAEALLALVDAERPANLDKASERMNRFLDRQADT